MDEPRFTIFEPHLAESFGVSRAVLADLRKNFLIQGVDWDLVNKKVHHNAATSPQKIAAAIREARKTEKLPAEDAGSSAGDDVAAVPSSPAEPSGAGHITSPIKSGEDLTEQSGNHQNGTQTLSSASAVPALAIEPLPVKTPGEPISLKCRKAETNRHIITAWMDDGKTCVRVSVKDNSNFVPDMPVRARLIQEPDLYELVGNCPRSKGRY